MCYVLLVFVALVVIVVIGENVRDVWVGGVGCVLLLVLLLWPRIIGVCSVSGEVVYWDIIICVSRIMLVNLCRYRNINISKN